MRNLGRYLTTFWCASALAGGAFAADETEPPSDDGAAAAADVAGAQADTVAAEAEADTATEAPSGDATGTPSADVAETETTGTPSADVAETETTDDYEGRAFPDSPEDDGAVLPDLLINAESGVIQDVLRSVPTKKLTAADVDSIVTPMDDEVLQVSPVSGILPHLNNLVDLESEQIPHYWLPDMSTEPVVTFYADKKPGKVVTSWELKLVNFRGLPVKHFKGSGPPPQQIEWDGRNEQGRMLSVGFPYSYVITVKDKGTNTYNYGGASFRITSLDYAEDGSRYVEISGNRLFVRGEPSFGEDGEDLIDKATDAFREHPLSAVTLTVVAPKKKLGDARAKAVVARVAEALIIPEEEIKVRVEEHPESAVEQDGFVRFEIHSAG